MDVKVFHCFSAGKDNYMYLHDNTNINYSEIILEKYNRTKGKLKFTAEIKSKEQQEGAVFSTSPSVQFEVDHLLKHKKT